MFIGNRCQIQQFVKKSLKLLLATLVFLAELLKLTLPCDDVLHNLVV